MVIKKAHSSQLIVNSLKNKKILITAGPTWVPIDSIRVISNIATGETGVLLAQGLVSLGAKVTLLLGPVECCCLNRKIKLIRFRFFDDLKNKIKQELASKKYDIVIHSAAVSDYRLKKSFSGKIKSAKKIWRLSLVPTAKIIDLIKRIDNSLYLVGFKFEPQAGKSRILKLAKALMKRSGLDLTVANSVNKKGYQAQIVSQDKIYGPFRNKNYLTRKLISMLK